MSSHSRLQARTFVCITLAGDIDFLHDVLVGGNDDLVHLIGDSDFHAIADVETVVVVRNGEILSDLNARRFGAAEQSNE